MEVELEDQKRACLVYVAETAAGVEAVKTRLEQNGFAVCAVEAKLEDALAAQNGETNLPEALAECIDGSDLCVFLLPESEANDGGLGQACGLASQLGKRIIGIVAGTRENYPEPFEDNAESMIRQESDRLTDAICGTEVWERPDRSPVADRPIKHVRCQ